MMAKRTGTRNRLLACAMLLMLAACGGPAAGPELQVRLWLEQGQAAAEARERSALVNMISPAYSDARGNSRDDINDMFRFVFLRQKTVTLVTKIEELSVIDGTAAEVVMTVGMAGSSPGALGFNADAYRFELELERHDEEWFLISARWGQLGDELR